MVHVIDQLLGHLPVHQHPAGQLLRTLVVGLSGLLQKAHVINGIRGAALAAAAAGEFGALSNRATFVIELPRCHRPAAVDLADHGIVANVDPVEKFLAELGGAAQHSNAPQRDSRMRDGHQEHGQSLVLGHIPCGAGQTQPVVGGKRAGAPRLGPVEHPPVALAFGPGDDTGQIRSPAGFGQQLHQHLVATQGRRDVLFLLLLGTGIQ